MHGLNTLSLDGVLLDGSGHLVLREIELFVWQLIQARDVAYPLSDLAFLLSLFHHKALFPGYV